MACEIIGNMIELGRIALENRDFATATEIFSNAIIEENSIDPNYWSCLAESLFYQAQFESSLRCWHEAASKDPTNKIIWIRISALYALLDQEDLAIHYYQIAEGLPVEG
ncbi:MAG: hypothetical protein E3J70_00865 [Candidatus Heimdallarchaeota archaeon]|nr:MAG: hypothetical protein E3J70_00865 [Candidatus Heimdallarchaeota archaeon]